MVFNTHFYAMKNWNDLSKKEGKKANSHLLNTGSISGFLFLYLIHLILLLLKKGILPIIYIWRNSAQSVCISCYNQMAKKWKRTQWLSWAHASWTVGRIAGGITSRGEFSNIYHSYLHTYFFGPATYFYQYILSIHSKYRKGEDTGLIATL